MTLTISNVRTFVGIIVVYYILRLVTADPTIDHAIRPNFAQRKLRIRERREIQKEILSVLGLPQRPRPHFPEKHTSAPMFMMELYKSMHVKSEQNTEFAFSKRDEGFFLDDTDLVMSFVNLLENDTKVYQQWYSKELQFDLSDMPAEEKLTAAELKIYKDKSLYNGTYQITVYQVPQTNTSKLMKLDMLPVYGLDSAWLTFDVTGINIDWVVNLQNNLVLQLMVETMDNQSIEPRSIGLVGRSGPQEKQPFLVAFFKSEIINLRNRRSTGENYWNPYNKEESENFLLNNSTEDFMSSNTHTNQHFIKQACMKHELYVSFHELGWQDWILAPEGYAAYYCDGECAFPLNSYMNATNHAIIQTLVHFISPDMVPKPCCAPTELQDITVLFFDDSSNILLKKYKNMVVQSCGCH